MDNYEKKQLIELLRTLLNNDDIEIIKCVIESVIDGLEQESFKNEKQ